MKLNENSTESPPIDGENKDKSFKVKATAFLVGVTGISILFGFGTTLAAARRKDPKLFDQGLSSNFEQINSHPTRGQKYAKPVIAETGASLALRALGWGTLYSVAGCSILFYGIWKLLGVNDLKEFRYKVGNMLPTIPKNNPPQGRTEFAGLNDLLQYIIDVDQEEKERRNKAK